MRRSDRLPQFLTDHRRIALPDAWEIIATGHLRALIGPAEDIEIVYPDGPPEACYVARNPLDDEPEFVSVNPTLKRIGQENGRGVYAVRLAPTRLPLDPDRRPLRSLPETVGVLRRPGPGLELKRFLVLERTPDLAAGWARLAVHASAPRGVPQLLGDTEPAPEHLVIRRVSRPPRAIRAEPQASRTMSRRSAGRVSATQREMIEIMKRVLHAQIERDAGLRVG